MNLTLLICSTITTITALCLFLADDPATAVVFGIAAAIQANCIR